MKIDKRIIQSEKAIIEASIQTLLLNPSAGMSDIATAASVGRATLYRHVESREALIEKLVLVCLEELGTAVAPLRHLTGRAAIEAGIEATMPLADRFHFLTTIWKAATKSEPIKQIDTQQVNEMAIAIDQAKDAGEINPSLPTRWIVAFHESTMMAAWLLIASGDVTINEAVTYAKQSFFSGCEKGMERRRV